MFNDGFPVANLFLLTFSGMGIFSTHISCANDHFMHFYVFRRSLTHKICVERMLISRKVEKNKLATGNPSLNITVHQQQANQGKKLACRNLHHNVFKMYGPPNLGTHVFVNEPVKQDYLSQKNEKSEMIEGISSTIYNRDDYMQTYEGNFIWNNMHGYGEYQCHPLKYKYEGQFYVNRKEGYGRFSYPSGAYFEGLYRNDQRFGPGVYTDAAGFQDVGIWVASKLIRLSRIFEPDNIMPRLAITDEDKIRILRYRKIIHLQKDDKMKDLAENLLESLTYARNYDKSVLARAEELYNRLCRDDRAPSFDKSRYDDTFFGHDSNQLTIDVLMTEEEVQQKIEAEKEERALGVEGSSSIVNRQIKESKMVHEIYNRSDIYIGEISQQDINVEILEDDKREKESADYCGIKEIDSQNMNNTLSPDNHEEKWNIFQSSAILIPKNFPEMSDENFANKETLHGFDETEVSEEEFDDFGRKKVEDMKPTKKVIVTDLMAWNNSSVLIDLLIHVFKHRNFEKKLSFDISKVLAGRRGSFRQEGTHEKAALELLAACSSGCKNIIPKLISKQNLDVDVADSRGNTGLSLAAANDQIEVIDTLLNLGANVDGMNDECLTPLSLCILRLLAVIHGLTNWSEAFLPKIVTTDSIIDDGKILFENFELWHGRVSYESLVQQLPKRMDRSLLLSKRDSEFFSKEFLIERESAIGKDAMDAGLGFGSNQVIKAEGGEIQKLEQRPYVQDNYDKDIMQTQKYIFDMTPIIGRSSSWRKFKKGKTKNKNVRTKVTRTDNKKQKEKNISSKSKELLGDPKETQDTDNSEISAKKAKVYTTISKLLRRGADPNFAQVPYPVLIMAIFTKMPTLVSEILDHGANPDTTLSKTDHSLTPLMILTVLQPASEHALMAKALLKAKANPSIRADPDYRLDLKERLNHNRLPEFIQNSEGMTPLHLLAIRPDMDVDVNGYLEELIRVICQRKCIKRSDLYYGHSPLSLSIFEGNFTAAKAFLKTNGIPVNEQLGADLGNAMLMLESRKLQELLPSDLLQECLELLLEHGGCPFASASILGEEYNQIEYGRKELTKMSNPPENKGKVDQNKRKSRSKGSMKSSKLPDTKNFTKSIDFIEKIAKEKLIERIKANFVIDLMDSPVMLLSAGRQRELLKEGLFKNAQTWMTAEDVAVVMKTMKYNRADVRALVRLFVTACISSHGGKLSVLNPLIENETEMIMNKVMPLVDPNKQIMSLEDHEVDRHVDEKGRKNIQRIIVCQQESDLEDNRFNVCFECLSIHGRVLILCPQCKRVYFCSEECNLKSAKQEENLYHQCPVFYHKEWMRLEKIAMIIDVDPITYMLRRFKNPQVYIDLERKTLPHTEARGKKSSRNRDPNTYINRPKCKDQDSLDHEKNDGEELFNGNNGFQHDYKSGSGHERKGQKMNGIMETEGADDDMRSNKRQKKVRNIDYEDKKSNKDKTDHLFHEEGVLRLKTKSKNVNKKGDLRIKVEDNENDKSLDNVESKKGIKKRYEDGSEMVEATANSDTKKGNEKGKRNRYGRSSDNEIERNDKDKIKLRNKKENEIQENEVNGMKLKKKRKEKHGKKENDKNSNSRIKENVRRGEKSGKRLNNLNKNEEKNVKNDLERKNKAKLNKQELKNGINENPKKEELTRAFDERYKTNKQCYTESANLPEKYLNWLLKISRSAGENLDIDMLLVPYVVFSQGDTYFRILSSNEYPRFFQNYSLI